MNKKSSQQGYLLTNKLLNKRQYFYFLNVENKKK